MTFEALLNDWCTLNKQLDEIEKKYPKTPEEKEWIDKQGERKVLGSKANLIEEIVFEAKKLQGVRNPHRNGGSRKVRRSRMSGGRL